MKKSLQIISASALFLALFSPCLAAISSFPTGANQPASTTQPTSTTTTPTSTGPTDTAGPSDAAAFDPAILQGASSGGTPAATNTTPTTTDTTPTDTQNPPAVIALPPTKPTRTTIPPRSIPPAAVTPVVTTPSSCPSIAPLGTDNVKCPTVETVPIIPQFPIALMAAPILAVFLFWLIFNYLNNGQIRTEKRFTARSVANAHRQNVDETRTREYQNLLDFLTHELSSPDGFHPDRYELISAKIQLLGSSQMQNLVGRIDNAIHTNNKPALKPLIKELGQQIRNEL